MQRSWIMLFCQVDDPKLGRAFCPWGELSLMKRVAAKTPPAPSKANRHAEVEGWLLGSQTLCRVCVGRFFCSMVWAGAGAGVHAAAGDPARRSRGTTRMSLMVWVIRQCSSRGTMQQAKVRQWRWWPLKQLTCPNLPAGRATVFSLLHWHTGALSSGGEYWHRSLEINRGVLASTGWKQDFLHFVSQLFSSSVRTWQPSLRGSRSWASCGGALPSQLRVWSQRWRTKPNRFSPSFHAANSNQVLRHLTCVLPWHCLSTANTRVRPGPLGFTLSQDL